MHIQKYFQLKPGMVIQDTAYSRYLVLGWEIPLTRLMVSPLLLSDDQGLSLLGYQRVWNDPRLGLRGRFRIFYWDCHFSPWELVERIA